MTVRARAVKLSHCLALEVDGDMSNKVQDQDWGTCHKSKRRLLSRPHHGMREKHPGGAWSQVKAEAEMAGVSRVGKDLEWLGDSECAVKGSAGRSGLSRPCTFQRQILPSSWIYLRPQAAPKPVIYGGWWGLNI
jgi:hypothetical protein